MSNYAKILSIACITLGLSACASGRPAQPEPTAAESDPQAGPHRHHGMNGGMGMMGGGMMGAGGSGMMGGGMMERMCPMAVPDASVTAADTDGGEALTFTTKSAEQVADLRARVKHMAEMHAQGKMMMHEHGGMMAGGPLPAASATTEDVDGGARITFKPKDPAELAKLREQLKQRAEHMQQGPCPMMDHRRASAPSSAE